MSEDNNEENLEVACGHQNNPQATTAHNNYLRYKPKTTKILYDALGESHPPPRTKSLSRFVIVVQRFMP